MIANHLILALCFALPGAEPEEKGVILGTVVNASATEAPLADAEVVLRVRHNGELVPLRETKTDGRGRFIFAGLPVGETVEYVAGANRHGVHYPGNHFLLTPSKPRAEVRLTVRDSVTAPSPLVLRRMEIAVRAEPGSVVVTETLLVDNPSPNCYVGEPLREGGEPVTLQLAVPSDFQRATFQQEFFGRRFAMGAGKMETGVPWPPGQREVKLTYVLPNEKQHRIWERPLDLPCDQVRLAVQGTDPNEVSCSLEASTGANRSEMVFESQGRLPAGHVLRLELGRLPVPWIVYARWATVVLLLGLVAGASLVVFKRRRSRPVVTSSSATARTRRTRRSARQSSSPARSP